nr:MAG TPA: hypothetical protein [Caudoviricetes sp.]
MHLIEIYQSLQTIQKKYLHLIKSYNLNFEAYPEIHKSKKSQITFLHLPTYLTFSYLHSFDFLLFLFVITFCYKFFGILFTFFSSIFHRILSNLLIITYLCSWLFRLILNKVFFIGIGL